MASEQDKRKLADLRVVDLRLELEKRGIEKMGVKAVLIERLIKAMEEEGHDPEGNIFEPTGRNTPKRTKSRSDPETESDETHELSLDVDEEIDGSTKPESKAQKSVAVLDSSLPKDVEELNKNAVTEITPVIKSNEDKIIKEENIKAEIIVVEKTATAEIIPLAVKDESVNLNTESKVVVKNDAVLVKVKKDEPIKAEVKPEIVVKKTAEIEKPVPDTNGVDNEDSINLDIGEDEEKLLADEEDSCCQEKDKDEGDRAGKSQESSGEAKKEGTKDEERKQNDDKGKTQEELKDDKAKSTSSEQKSKDDKDKSKKCVDASSSSSRNLWVSGLSSVTRATDLKQMFSKYGKVIGAKVVTNARTPGARCYGYVTMATSEEASKCIQYLHRTELHGRMISVERAKGDSGPPRKSNSKENVADKKRHERKSNGKPDEKKKDPEEAKKEVAKPDAATKSDKVDVKVKEEATTKSDVKEGAASAEVEADSANEKRMRDTSRERKEKRRIVLTKSPRPYRARDKSPGRKRPIAPLLTFAQIGAERERNRLRERERELREVERRARDRVARQEEVERRQREESQRLEREKIKLRQERERIECERAELQRLERESQKLERERLDREREELKRQQLRSAMKAPQRMHHVLSSLGQPPPRFVELRRAVKRPTEERRDNYPNERKRVATDGRFEPPPPRFEVPSVHRPNDFQVKKDPRRSQPDFGPRRGEPPAKFERNTFVSVESRTSRRESAPEVPQRSREHAVAPQVVRGKDNRFERGAVERGATSSFRVSRDGRRPESDHRSKVDPRQATRDRYQETSEKNNFGNNSSKALVSDRGRVSSNEGRYTDRTNSTWHGGNSSGPAPVKPFGGAVMGPRDTWTSLGDRKSEAGWSRPVESGGWTGSSGSSLFSRGGPALGNSLYSSSSQNLPPSMSGLGMSSGPYTSDRFESYKHSMGPIHKY